MEERKPVTRNDDDDDNNDNNNNNNNNRICLLIDVAIPSDWNIIQKKTEKKLKHKTLGIELDLMWNTKYFVIPVITGVMGIVSKGLRKYLETIPEPQSISSLKKPY
jgi:hypothetical protein